MEWIGNIPEHWRIDRLKDISKNVVGGGTPKSSIKEYWDEGEINWVSPTDFGKSTEKYISNSEKKITQLGLSKSSANLLPEGTIIMSSRASIGDVKIADCNLSTNQGFVSFITDYKIHNNYLYYIIKGFLGDYFSNIASGTTFMEISRRMVKLENIPLPPISEQQAIATYLDKACMRIDRIIEIKQKQLEKIEELRKSEIYYCCTKGLNSSVTFKKTTRSYIKEIPKHWKIEKLKRGCERIDTGGTPKTENSENFINGTIKWYAPDCFGSMILDKPKKMINEVALKNNEIKIYPKNSIFFVGVGATAGKVSITEEPASCNQQINILQTNHKLLPRFLLYHLKVIEKEIIKFAQYTTLPILNQSKTGYIDICFPPLKEQKEIVEYLDNFQSNSIELESKLKSQIKTLKSYRKSLIHECVTGKKQVFQNNKMEKEASLMDN